MSMRARVLLVATIAVAYACAASDEPRPDEAAERPEMPSMDMGQSGAMMQAMTSHIETVQQIPGDSLATVLPAHRQQVANMIAQMNREMRDMSMPADAAWEAVVDSLRGDLTRMPEMSIDELQQLMPEHAVRVTRLMEMHRSMMEAMHR